MSKSVPVGSFPCSVFSTMEVRPLHAIWCGIPLHDCLGGEPSTLANLTPRRWAIGALAEARSFVIERNGAYAGSVRLIPLQNSAGQIVYSFAPAAPMFDAMLVTKGENLKRPLVEQWIEEAFERINDQRPFVLSQSRSSDISQLKAILRDLPNFLLGGTLVPARQFRLLDPRAPGYLNGLSLGEGVKPYGDNFLFDATLFDAGDLDIVRSTVKITEEFPDIMPSEARRSVFWGHESRA
jgi:hypothetical protein